MVAEKVRHYQGKNVNLQALSEKIQDYLKNDKYTVQAANTPSGIVIQARKGGILRDIIAAERALTIMISGDPNNFTVRVGVGKWKQNLAVAAAEAILLTELFLIVDVPEMLWNVEIENKLVKQIDQFVG
jgi:hypothetical protein